MVHIYDLPPETIEQVLTRCDPCDVAAVAQTCQQFRDLIYFSDDNHLWRSLYLAQPLDDPRICVNQAGKRRLGQIDWKAELHAVIRARTVMNNPELLRPGEINIILKTLLKLVTNVRPASPSFSDDDEISQNLLWVAAYLRKHDGFFLDYLRSEDDEASEDIQLRCRLHTYFGLTHGDVKHSARSASRAYVYNMHKYTEANSYGPYMMDGSGRVNWVHVQAIHHVVSMHVVDLQEDDDFEYAIFPMSLPHIQPILPNDIDLERELDWAGIEGDWVCSFCFCDHRDLLEFNQTALMHPTIETLDPSFFDDPMFREVFRSMKVKITLTDSKETGQGPSNRPVIHFKGDMGNPSSALMTGWVEVTTDDQIRWHFVSGESGNNIWSSEGIQVGGVRSLFGVLGTWTTTFHDSDDPIGPFWLRKLPAFGEGSMKA